MYNAHRPVKIENVYNCHIVFCILFHFGFIILNFEFLFIKFIIFNKLFKLIPKLRYRYFSMFLRK